MTNNSTTLNESSARQTLQTKKEEFEDQLGQIEATLQQIESRYLEHLETADESISSTSTGMVGSLATDILWYQYHLSRKSRVEEGLQYSRKALDRLNRHDLSEEEATAFVSRVSTELQYLDTEHSLNDVTDLSERSKTQYYFRRRSKPWSSNEEQIAWREARNLSSGNTERDKYSPIEEGGV